MDEKRMKGVWKGAAVIAFVLTISSLLAACGGDKEDNHISDDLAKQGVFREKEKTKQVSLRMIAMWLQWNFMTVPFIYWLMLIRKAAIP